MESLLNQKDYMGSTMIFFEFAMQSDAPGELQHLAPLIKRLINEAPDSGGVKQVISAVSKQPKSKAGLQQALGILEDARRQDFAHRYVLNVFLANYYDALGQVRKTPNLILEALEKNPSLPGPIRTWVTNICALTGCKMPGSVGIGCDKSTPITRSHLRSTILSNT